jgi:hypothetical protein
MSTSITRGYAEVPVLQPPVTNFGKRVNVGEFFMVALGQHLLITRIWFVCPEK